MAPNYCRRSQLFATLWLVVMLIHETAINAKSSSTRLQKSHTLISRPPSVVLVLVLGSVSMKSCITKALLVETQWWLVQPLKICLLLILSIYRITCLSTSSWVSGGHIKTHTHTHILLPISMNTRGLLQSLYLLYSLCSLCLLLIPSCWCPKLIEIVRKDSIADIT